MEIKILVKENERAELDKFIETCKEHGMELTKEGGGRLPNFSGYYAEFKGVRWQKSDTGEGKSNIPDVKASLPDKDNYDYLRGFSDGYGGPEPHECFPEGFKDINEVMDRMWELGEQRK